MPLPPGPKDSAFSQLGRLRKDFLGYLLDAAQYGDLVLLRPAPGARIYLVNHPALVEDVLIKRPELFHKTRMTRRMVGKFLGQGLVLSEEAEHHRQRRQLQPVFHGKRLAAHAPLIAAITQNYTAGWQPGQVVSIASEMTRLTMQVVARTLFGVAPGGNDEGVGAAMQQFAESMAGRFKTLPLPDWLPIARHREERRAIATLDAAIQRMLQAPARPGGDDLLSLLRAAQGTEAFTAQEVRDHLATFYFAGHETTAKLITWALILLAQHPNVQATLRQQLAEAEDPAALPLLDAVLKETLRLYPPAWVFDREPVQDVELGGHTVPKGATIYLSPYVSHRDARFFEQPAAFQPQRFATEAPALPRTACYPFGFGPRNCIGRGLAELNTKASLVMLLRQFGFAGNGARAMPLPGATLGVDEGFSLRLTA